MNSRTCGVCDKRKVDESLQTFIYRDNWGNKSDACIRPACNICISAGALELEYSQLRLYIGTNSIREQSLSEWKVEPIKFYIMAKNIIRLIKEFNEEV
jgi:hypothetical protein